MPDRTLDEKREQMINFLLENIIAKEIKRIGNDIIFASGRDKYFIKTLSRQADFPVHFEEDSRKFDTDREKLKAMFWNIAYLIEGKNKEGYIPGFVLLRAETDYHQLKRRTKSKINEGHFLKQKLPSPRDKKPSYSNKTLDLLELVLNQFYKNAFYGNKKRAGKISIKNKRPYFHELTYFNTKENTIEIVAFADTRDPLKFKIDCCPICTNPNEKGYDHSSCKENPDYLNYVLKREEARYSKLINISRIRRHKKSRTKSDAEKGLIWTPAKLDTDKLHLPQKELYIAVVK